MTTLDVRDPTDAEIPARPSIPRDDAATTCGAVLWDAEGGAEGLLTPGMRAAIAAGAGWMAERGAAGRPGPPVDDATAGERRARWCRAVARGDEVKFEQVLAWRGLDVRMAATAPTPAGPGEGGPLPDWIDDLARMLEAGCAAPPLGMPPYLDPQEPVPGETLLAPLVEAAARGPRRLVRAMGAAATALAPLERRLLRSLAQAMVQCVDQQDGATALSPGLPAAYPALAHLLTSIWTGWIAATEEMLARLAADQAALAEFLGLARAGPPLRFTADGADGHDGGRYVCVVTLTEEARVVYKPRDMTIDAVFRRFALDLQEIGIDVADCVPRSLVREGYGWAAFIQHRKAADADAQSRFWSRAGAVLGVLTAIGGVDMHYGNVIAAGDRPVLVDLETVLRPPMPGEEGYEADLPSSLGRITDLVAASALSTMLLPLMLHRGGGHYVDIGALSAPPLDSDSHRICDDAPEAGLLRHAATLRDAFAQTLERLRRHAPGLLEAGGAVDRFGAARIRVVFRDTNLYARLLSQSVAPNALRDGVERELVLEQLARVLAPFAERPPLVAVVEAEKRAMRAGEIPRFEVGADGCDLCDHTGPVAPGLFRHSAVAAMRVRLGRLSAEDDVLHERLVGLSLQARLIGAVPRDGGAGPLPDRDGAPFSEAPPSGIPAALAVGRALSDLAVTGRDGDVAWFGIERQAGADFFHPVGHVPHLGEGHLGIALFLAALARTSGDPAIADLAQRALPPLRPRASSHVSLSDPDLGLASGIGGRIWGFVALSRLGGPAWCLDTAAQAAATAMRHAPVTKRWDAAGGLAGLVLGCLALRSLAPEAVPDDDLGAVAGRLGERVIAVGMDRAGARAGLMSGATGAGAALVRAATVLDRSDLRRLGRSCLAVSGPAEGGPGWARGTAGRLLCRAGLLSSLPGDDALLALIRDDARGLADPAAEGDGMWRGAAGLLPALTLRDEILRDEIPVGSGPDLRDRLSARAAAGGLMPVMPALPGVVLPGLMNGIAGIGYALLRQDEPGLPDIHTFAPGPGPGAVVDGQP